MPRADLFLLEHGYAASRSAAQQLIAAGRVSANGQPVVKANQKLEATMQISITPDAADRYVSRGGLKMQGALEHCGLQIAGWRALDVGQSTGGFSDCLLQQGATRVVGVDVGHDQLAQRLRDDERVRYFEGVNARALDHAELLEANDGQLFDLMVCDVSFISLTLILPSALPLLAPHGKLLSLVKPQFEVGREGLGHGGIVRDEALYPQVKRKIHECLLELGWELLDWFDSPITGGDGNREFFVLAGRSAQPE